MSHFEAKVHQIRLLASVCLFVRSFVGLCLRWSLTLSGRVHLELFVSWWR